MSHDHGGMGGMPTTPGSMSDGGMSSNDMMMHMYFFWGKDVIVLFSGWPNHSLGMYILALFFVFLLAVTIEVLSDSPAVKASTNPMVGGLTQASVYALRMGLAYLVMLAVMSFNLGIFIVAVAGHAVGYFLVKFRALARASRTEAMSSGITPKV